MKAICNLCRHNCVIEEGKTGFCSARENRSGKIVCKNYGKVTSIALDPIEKKPLYRFYPGSLILSVGSYGCNLSCPFCQNCEISMADGDNVKFLEITPKALVKRALELVPRGNIGVAYTYNEPLIGYEFVLDCARLAKGSGLKNVVVTNGYINEKPLKELLPFIDAMNIDLKGFTESYYRTVSGDLETVKGSIKLAAENCHVEVTTLIVPDENDSEEEIDALSRWLASISPEIPLHITRFFPRFKMADRAPTPLKTIYRLADLARKNLKYVYEGNC